MAFKKPLEKHSSFDMSPLHDVLTTYIQLGIEGHQSTIFSQQVLGSIAKYPFVVNMDARYTHGRIDIIMS